MILILRVRFIHWLGLILHDSHILNAPSPLPPATYTQRMCAGVGGAALGSPFQLLKTRMQAHSSGSAAAAGKYGNMMTALGTVCREEGVAGLRKAIDTCMLKVAVASAVQLSVYDITKRKMHETPAWQERVGVTGTHIAASVLASFCVVTVINPIEVRLHYPTAAVAALFCYGNFSSFCYPSDKSGKPNHHHHHHQHPPPPHHHRRHRRRLRHINQQQHQHHIFMISTSTSTNITSICIAAVAITIVIVVRNCG